jgi:DNA-binding LacI/PurR family transcriptional regulator
MDSQETRSRPTVRDVARLAGVSIASVSRVVNGLEGISDGVKQRVLSAVSTLDYAPDTSASLLSRNGGMRKKRRLRLVNRKVDSETVTALELENAELRRLMADLHKRLKRLTRSMQRISERFPAPDAHCKVRRQNGDRS